MKCPYRINTIECEGRKIEEFAECDDECPLFYTTYNSVEHKYKEHCKKADGEGKIK